MRCAIYARVSTEEQKNRQTIRSQLEELPKYAAKQGWTVIGTYKDDGRSGESIMARPEFQRLLRDAEAGTFDVVLAIDRDRLARSEWAEDMAFIQDKFRRYRIKVAFPGTTLDLEKPEDRLVDDIRGGVARYEKHQIVRRMRRGKLSKLRAGKFVDGTLPYGYRCTDETQIIVDEATGLVYRQIILMLMVEGLSLNKIAVRLNREGVASPQTNRAKDQVYQWSSHGLSRVLKNPAYHQGYVVSGRYKHTFQWMKSQRRPGATVRRRFVEARPEAEWIKIPAPPLIATKEWEAVQRRIAASRSHNFNWTKQIKANDPYLLRGLARCGLCGAKLQMRAGFAQGSRYYFCMWTQAYATIRYGKKVQCTLPWIPAAAAERSPLSILLHCLVMPEEVVAEYAKLVTGATYGDQVRERLAHVTKEAKHVTEQQRRLLDRSLAKHFSPEVVAEKAAELRSRLEWLAEQQATLEAELAAVEQKRETLAWMQDQSRGLMESRRLLERWWQDSTTQQRQRLLRTLIDPDGGGPSLSFPRHRTIRRVTSTWTSGGAG